MNIAYTIKDFIIQLIPLAYLTKIFEIQITHSLIIELSHITCKVVMVSMIIHFLGL